MSLILIFVLLAVRHTSKGIGIMGIGIMGIISIYSIYIHVYISEKIVNTFQYMYAYFYDLNPLAGRMLLGPGINSGMQRAN